MHTCIFYITITYRFYANKTEYLINERKIDFARVSKKHTPQETVSLLLLMYFLTLINEINSIFRNLCDSN